MSTLFGSSEVEDELASMAGHSDVKSDKAQSIRRMPAARLNFSDLAKQAQSHKPHSLGSALQPASSSAQVGTDRLHAEV